MNYSQLPSQEVLVKVAQNLKERNIEPIIVANKEEALAKIKELIPAGASIMNGASKTLEQIGYLDFIKSNDHRWNNLHTAILAETDPEKQLQLRKQSALADYYLGSVHALAESGEMLIASNTGSQLPHIVYTSPNVIFVVGAQKIVPTFADTFLRLNEYVVPLEDQRMKALHGSGTAVSKILIFNKESPFAKRKITVLLVNEILGF